MASSIVYLGKRIDAIAILTHIPNAIAPFHRTASIPGDRVYLGNGKARSAVGSTRFAIARWE
ncbi:MAG: hypothetical protein RIG63_18515 [Coleofasciculus chthonoplastes F3-SA18-01]|uniref:hypothetical protein n=1 Tax=Coleofasciculus chthonoplastes TaxID=64178 RepID=UPI0032F9A441